MTEGARQQFIISMFPSEVEWLSQFVEPDLPDSVSFMLANVIQHCKELDEQNTKLLAVARAAKELEYLRMINNGNAEISGESWDELVEKLKDLEGDNGSR